MRCDQENALVDFAQQVIREREKESGVRTQLESNPVADSQKAGHSESAVKQVEGLARSLRLDLEDAIKAPVPCASAFFAWLLE